MSRRPSITGAAVGALALALTLGCGGGASDPGLPEVSAGTHAGEAAAPAENAVRIEAVGSAALRARLASSGTIEARRTTELAAEVPGRIVRVHADVGDEVATGAPLFQIDPGPYRMIVAEAEAALALARAESANADAEAERLRVLVESAVASEQRFDQLRTIAEVSRARVAAAEARLARARRDLARTEVRSPYDASVVERRAHEGTMAGQAPILVIQERGALEAILDVPEATPVAVRVGDPVKLFVEGRGEPIVARIDRVAGRVDPQTRTYEVRADLAASDVVKAGSYVRAEIEPTRANAQAVVELGSVLDRDGRRYVLRVEDGVVRHVPVRVGIVVDGRAEILGGISVGDEVVAGEAVARLADGTRLSGSKTAAQGADPDDDRLSAASALPAPEEPGT